MKRHFLPSVREEKRHVGTWLSLTKLTYIGIIELYTDRIGADVPDTKFNYNFFAFLLYGESRKW